MLPLSTEKWRQRIRLLESTWLSSGTAEDILGDIPPRYVVDSATFPKLTKTQVATAQDIDARPPVLLLNSDTRFAHLIETSHDFYHLGDRAWDNKIILDSLITTAMRHGTTVSNQTRPLATNESIEDLKAPFYMLHVIFVEPTYRSKTEYNLFTLIRLGNKFSRDDELVSHFSTLL